MNRNFLLLGILLLGAVLLLGCARGGQQPQAGAGAKPVPSLGDSDLSTSEVQEQDGMLAEESNLPQAEFDADLISDSDLSADDVQEGALLADEDVPDEG